jgi:polyhydroxyalkanoate synthase
VAERDALSIDLFSEQQKFLRRMFNMSHLLEQANEVSVGKTPSDVVFRTHKVKLLHYRRKTAAVYREPVVLCYALINRPYILDLMPDKSVVCRYLEQGFDVYMIDWGVPSYEDRRLVLKDYICGFLMDVVQFVLRESGCDKLHLLGYCMGGTMSTLFTAQNPRLVKSLTLLAAPIDFAGRDTLLNFWTDRNYFDVDALVDSYGNCPGWFLQTCFMFMKPVHNLLGKYVDFYDQMDDPRTVVNFVAMERWVHDNIPVTGGVFREFVKRLYQSNELVRGKYRLDGKYVDLARIRCPLLLLTAKNDHLAAPSSTEGIRPHVGSRDVTSMSVEGGHVGLVTGSRAQATLWPAATRWLADRSSAAPSGKGGGGINVDNGSETG